MMMMMVTFVDDAGDLLGTDVIIANVPVFLWMLVDAVHRSNAVRLCRRLS